MAKPELGTKRLCPNCGTRYYDLNRDPILCPKCGTQFDVHTSARARPATARETEDIDTEEEEAEVEAEEFVTLEEADDEVVGGPETPEVEDEDIEVEDIDEDDEDTFLEDDEEGDDGLSDIIGDVDEDEEP